MLMNLIMFALPCVAYTYENIALHKIAWQLHPYNPHIGNASNAVDGFKTNFSAFGGQCTLSADGQYEAVWRVDLGAVLGIHHITIYYRTGNYPWGPDNGFTTRFLGFSVYISNTTDKENGVLCFKDDTFTRYTIPAVITLNCTNHGRYVIYYNNRTSSSIPPDYSIYAHNELCEFEVYGCPTPNCYGEDCSQSCQDQCMDSRCHIETGDCFGCKVGYQGPTCDQPCQKNTYGYGCSMIYGLCVNGEQCYHVNGTCHNGCEAGIYGSHCQMECPQGLYGRNCSNKCSEKCFIYKDCNIKTGVCFGGCAVGWKPPMCNEECDDGTFGTNCSNYCGHCHQGQSCDVETGACPNGCDSGYKGIHCNESCAHSFYGPNCRLRCSNTCINRTCDAEKGSCDMVQNEIGHKNSRASDIIGESREILFAVLTALVVVFV
ncbi:cell death abnormality protein 1-like [Crassostrea angulata]|uniref:cell death abnormality protein 1-like n=1 Tax=Magallana angulata TaxID=2784310 RepID=UPI0022B0FF5E|nr:cell death abnormality protein 1-like [Crassostrea angulata]